MYLFLRMRHFVFFCCFRGEFKMTCKCSPEAEQKFMQWFSGKVSPSQLTDFYYLYKEMEKFCISKRIISRSLFDEIQDYEQAQRLIRILSYDLKFQRTFAKYGRKKHVAFTMFELFYKQNAAVEQITHDPQPPVAEPAPVPPPVIEPKPEKTSTLEGNDKTFELLLSGEQYSTLKNALKREGIDSIESLKEINLWEFMNQRCLYTVQSRLIVSKEISNKLQDLNDSDAPQKGYSIHYANVTYSGSTPANAFLKFLKDVAYKYPLKFRSLVGAANLKIGLVVLHKINVQGCLKLINPTAYIDTNLSSDDVKESIDWILRKCAASDTSFTIEDNISGTKTITEPVETPVVTTPTPVAPVVTVPRRDNEQLVEPDIQKTAEEIVLKADLDGITYDDLQIALRTTRVATKAAVEHSQAIIELKQRIIHREALVDFDDGANELEDIIDKLLKKNNGVVSSAQLYEFSKSQMTMFLNDNGIDDQQSVFDLARYLFEKIKYHGKHYAFKSNTYLSLPEASIDSNIDIVCKYAKEKGTIVSFEELETYMKKLGLNTTNLRGTMKIDKEPIFLIYQENEYLLAELIHMDDDFFDRVKKSIERLFEDIDDHYIILRQIDERWFDLLPPLPCELDWTPMLLQQILRYYSDKVGARTIQAMDSQSTNTLHAMMVKNDSPIQDFRDAVAVYLCTKMPERTSFEAEELRQELVKSRMIAGNQLIWNMPKALSDDPRFIWSGDGQRVTVRIENG